LGRIEFSNLDRITLEGLGPLVFDTGDNQAALVRTSPLAFELRVNANVAFGDEETLIADLSQGSRLVFAGSLTDATVNLFKEGAGRMELSGDNPLWTGKLAVHAGEVRVGSPSALGSVLIGTTVSREGTLTFQHASAEPVVVLGGTWTSPNRFA
jgi:autotransporter-associated beta strand protein